MSHLVIRWPDEAAESVRAARGRLLLAGRALRAMSFDERLERVADIVAIWSAPDSPWRRELAALLADDLPFTKQTLEEGLNSALTTWNRDTFTRAARLELGVEFGNRQLAPYECISVLAGGTIPMPTMLSAILPLALGSPTLLRETSKDSATLSCLLRSISDRDQELARCIETVRFPAEDGAALEAFLESPCVVATGSDETITSVRSRLTSGQRLVAYGHRFSVAILGNMLFRNGDDEVSLANRADIDTAARGVALDVARWDQAGCLSPVAVYLVGTDVSARKKFADRVAAELAALSQSQPRGEISSDALALFATERAEARMRAAVAPDGALFEGSDSCVSLEQDATPRRAPLGRFLHIYPVDTVEALGRALHPISRHLSTCTVAGFASADTQALTDLMTVFGVSRICAPGTMQTPPIDWPHDGMPLFLPMARFSQSN